MIIIFDLESLVEIGSDHVIKSNIYNEIQTNNDKLYLLPYKNVKN